MYFGTFVPKSEKKKKKKNYSQRFVNYVKCHKDLNIHNLCTLKRYSAKMGCISFFSSSGMQKLHHLLGCHATGINFSLLFFLVLCVFPKFNMLSQKSDKNNQD